MSFGDDCIFDEGERWEVPELDALERGQQQQTREPDTALRGAAVRLVGPDRARLAQKRRSP